MRARVVALACVLGLSLTSLGLSRAVVKAKVIDYSEQANGSTRVVISAGSKQGVKLSSTIEVVDREGDPVSCTMKLLNIGRGRSDAKTTCTPAQLKRSRLLVRI